LCEEDVLNFQDKIVVITGGAGGIGRAAGEIMGQRGASLFITDVGTAVGEDAVADWREREIPATFIRADLTEIAEIQALFHRVVEQAGRIDVLVTCAGVSSLTRLAEITPEEWDRVFAVNLKATFFCCQEALHTMVEQKRGKIVTIASAAAKIGGVAVGAHYSASKAGIICLTKSLALYAAPFGINVNCVCPGPTATAMTDAWGEAINTEFAQKIPFKRYGKPEEIGEVIAFLASDKASYLTGETVDVNGGLVMD
jgi:NAD(P)-dependent dehydrogenase (short-subunit alcohol dehydrogenase family)